MKMLNFWRSKLDRWLNDLAVDAGADFRDQTTLLDFSRKNGLIKLKIATEKGLNEVCARYLVAADGIHSRVRRRLRAEDFAHRHTGITINYYLKGDSKLDPGTLYMLYDKDICPMMFAWAYMKGGYWVIGTAAYVDITLYGERLLKHIKEKYSFGGCIVSKEGFTSLLKEGVYLGEENILLTGDAAGLVDLYRGMGMDTAALSGRLAAKAISRSEEADQSPLECYQRYMKRLVKTLYLNAEKQRKRYTSNKTLEESLTSRRFVLSGLAMLVALRFNRLLPPEHSILLPL